jgi:hypothetical protein
MNQYAAGQAQDLEKLEAQHCRSAHIVRRIHKHDAAGFKRLENRSWDVLYGHFKDAHAVCPEAIEGSLQWSRFDRGIIIGWRRLAPYPRLAN